MSKAVEETPQDNKTRAGNYFISNYPPYSFWTPDRVPEAMAALNRPPRPDTPLGIYLHTPFCRKRCHFCYFRVYTGVNSKQVNTYLDGAIKELELYARQPFIGGRKPTFVYFGGGTPSFLSTRQLTSITGKMKAVLPWDEAEEITFECEPGTLNEQKLKFIKELGVTRLSLGVENYDADILEFNGRAHRAVEIDRAYEWAQACGFPQINIDLMHGLPGQSTSAAAHDIESAIAFSPEHLSLYQLTIEPNTRFAAEPPPLPDEETCWQIRCTLEERAAGAGFERYEVSAFSRPVNRCRHNLNYWEFGDYIGIGAGAHAKITDRHGVRRYAREKHPHRYIETAVAGKLLPEIHPVTGSELAFEFVLNALRLKEGFSVALFEQRTGLSWHCLSSAFEQAKDRGLLNITNHQVCATTLGYRFLDDLVGLFLPTPA